MNGGHVREADAWLAQAQSDARTARALLNRPTPMTPDDIGCHVAGLCAQAVEKSMKGCVVLNRSTPDRRHRADKYLSRLLGGGMLHYEEHRGRLARLFDPSTKATVRQLMDLTPGALGRVDAPNTEYPWRSGRGTLAPARASEFADPDQLSVWAEAARRISTEIAKLVFAVRRLSLY